MSGKYGELLRDAFAEVSLEPAEEAIQAPLGSDAKRGECFSGVARVLAKIYVVEGRGLTERDERLAGGTHKSAGLEEPFAERLEIQIVVTGWEAARAEGLRTKRHQKCVRGFRYNARAGLQEALAGVGHELDNVFRVEAESAERLGDQDVAAFRQAHLF